MNSLKSKNRTKIAIVGSGIAGLSAAYDLKNFCDIEIFEKASELGGHIRPRTVLNDEGQPLNIDTAFLGFKPEVYPGVTSLFNELGVETLPKLITGSVHIFDKNIHFLRHEAHLQFGKELPLEWADATRKFYGLLAHALQNGLNEMSNVRLDDFAHAQGFPPEMINTLIIPDVASIWGVQPHEAAAMSLQGAVGSLLTVGRGVHILKNSTADYLDKLLAACRFTAIHKDCVDLKVKHGVQGEAQIIFQGETLNFDRIIIAAPAEEALKILLNPSADELRLLPKFNYVSTVAVLHRDPAVLAPLGLKRGHFNYVKASASEENSVTITWDMNALLNVQTKEPILMTTANPSFLQSQIIDKNKMIDTAYHRHCISTPEAVSAIPEMIALNKKSSILFCGSYFKPAATHEAAFQSGLAAAKIIRSSEFQIKQFSVENEP